MSDAGQELTFFLIEYQLEAVDVVSCNGIWCMQRKKQGSEVVMLKNGRAGQLSNFNPIFMTECSITFLFPLTGKASRITFYFLSADRATDAKARGRIFSANKFRDRKDISTPMPFSS